MVKSKFVNSLELIGGTPLVKLNSVIPSNGVALVGAVKGYNVVLVMSENMSAERRMILGSFGAKTELSRAEFGMEGTIQRAEEMLAENPGYFMPQQFNNPANPEVHRQTTGPEIISAMNGESVDGFVAGIGTGGTITGVGEVLKKHYRQVKVVGVEPATSAVLSGRPPGPHKIQGIGAGFKPNVLNLDLLDRILPVSDEDAFQFAQRMGKEEGLLVGISSGAACFAANELAKELGPGKNVVVILPDTGERYFSFNKYF